MNLNRRTLLAGLAATSALPLIGSARAAVTPLTITSRTLDVKGIAAKVFGIVGANGKPGLEITYGDGFNVDLRNDTDTETLIHWHGLTPPLAMDGIPVLSGATLKPGETRAYKFPNLETGTHWMHSHHGLEEQRLLAAPLIVKERGDPLVDEQEHVIMLHDFTFRDPQEILSELRGGGHDMAQMDQTKMDHSKMADSDQPAMAMHLNDIQYDAILANDRTLDDPEIVRAEKGGRFRLRIINAAAASNMWVDLGELEGTLIAVDGKVVQPLRGKRFPLAIAQRADIRVALPEGAGAWTVLFQPEGGRLRGGVILQSGDAKIEKIGDQADTEAPAVDMSLEARLQTIIAVRPDPVSRVEMVMLTGGGKDYSWGLNGKASMLDVLFNVKEGGRYELMLHNMTGMAHPMHLHGHYFQVVEINGRRFEGAVRDTVLVPAGGSVSIRFDAMNPGTWPLHCHHLYHMNSGMMGTIAYTGAA